MPRFYFLLSLFVLAAVAGCSTANSTDQKPAGTVIAGAGATLPAPLYKVWIEEYMKEFPGRTVSYASVGSGEGTTRFLAESVDFGASDAALTDEQIASVKRGAVLVPATAGSLTIAYNSEGLPAKLKLPRSVYVDIFLGKISKWNDPQIAKANPEEKLPDWDIVRVVRQDSSGTTFAFTNHLSAISEEWRGGPGVGKAIQWKDAMRANGNEGVAGLIKQSKAAIGYVEYGTARRAGLGMATLENKEGQFIEPTGTSGLATLVNTDLPENLRLFFVDPDGKDSYPIVTYTWLLLYRDHRDPETSKAVKHFVSWCLNDGQRFSESLGFIRLAPKTATAAQAAVDRVSP